MRRKNKRDFTIKIVNKGEYFFFVENTH
jgi:hypothetical protein